MASLVDALVREAADDPLSAQEIVDQVLSHSPDDVEALVIASRVRNRLALRDDAQRAAERALALAPTDPSAAVALAACLLRRPSGLDRAHALITEHFQGVKARRELAQIAWEGLARTIDHDRLEALGDIVGLYQGAPSGRLMAAPLPLRSFTATPTETSAFMALFNGWAESLIAQAQAQPLPARTPQPRAKPRIGLLTHQWLPFIVQAFEPMVNALKNSFDFYGYALPPTPGLPTPGALLRRMVKHAQLPIDPRAAAAVIAEDDLDLLIDLNGLQQTGTMIACMAWRPARRCASWVARPTPAFLSTIDFQILDPHLAPADLADRRSRALMLPEAWAYLVTPATAAISPAPPSAANHVVTFGSMQPPEYLRPLTFDFWAGAMQAVPESRFLWVRPECVSTVTVAHFKEAFRRRGVDPERIECRPNKPGVVHVSYYNEIDVALDAAPVSGGIVSLEALWMGVPVVSVAGPLEMHRITRTFNAVCGLEDNYVDGLRPAIERARAVAQDLPYRQEIRRALRPKLQSSPICDPVKFAKQLGAAIKAALAEE